MLRVLTFFLPLLMMGHASAAPGPMVLSAHSPRNPAVTGTLSITQLEAVCTLRDALARTTVTLTLAVELPKAEPVQPMEGTLVFPLPPDCVITGAALDLGAVLRRASLTFKETARAAYTSVVSRQLDPCLVTLRPDGMVEVQVFPITPATPRRVQLEFSQILTPGPGGLTWEFPLRLPQPVAEASLTTDAPQLPQHGKARPQNFSGGSGWSLTAPLPPPGGVWPAHPDENGKYLFQALLPAAPPPPAPHRLLLAVDTSALQQPHDAKSEQRFLTDLIQRMGEGHIALAVFNTFPQPVIRYEVHGGKCDALFQALASLTYDGAPRPEELKLSAISADLTIIISSLQHPLASWVTPELPAKAPVIVLDSVSSAPSTVALRLASKSGGAVFNPRSAGPPVYFPSLPLAAGSFSNPTFHLLPDRQFWFVTGTLGGTIFAGSEQEKHPPPAKDNDLATGLLTSQHRGRTRLFELMQDAPASLRHALPTEWASAPFLSGLTGFIVLEEWEQYHQFRIPFPPDLIGSGPVFAINEEPVPIDFSIVSQSILRSPGSSFDAFKWHRQLIGKKLQIMNQLRTNLLDFQQRRVPSDTLKKLGLDDPTYQEAYQKPSQLVTEAKDKLPQITSKYAGAPPADRVALIRQARTLQEAKVALMEILNPELWGGMFRSGGYTPVADPFNGPVTIEDSVSELDRDSNSGQASAADETGLPSASALQADASAGRMEAAAISTIISSAERLHRQGRETEAIRSLSNLAARPQPEHGLLRLFAWQLMEWDQPRIALNVMIQADFLHGPTAVTERDVSLAKSGFPGSPATLLKTLSQLPLGVAQREAEGMQGRGAADWRIVLECADETADADLEIEGPDFETASWQNPLPAFGGALSFDGKGFTPEDFILLTAAKAPLTLRVRLDSKSPAPVRVTIFQNWARPDQKKQVFLLPQCQPGLTTITEISAAK